MLTEMNAGMLLAAALAIPLAMLAAALTPHARKRLIDYLPFAPLPALFAAITAPDGTTLVLPRALLGLALSLDKSGAMLLGAASLLWVAGGIYARGYLKDPSGQFAVWWLITLTGSLGVFLAADMIGFYLFYTLVSLAAYGLVVHDDTPTAHRAAGLYVALALLGEAFLLLAFILLAVAAPDGSLLISDAVAAFPASPWRDPALLFIILGFGLKIGLVPFHIWMPLAYAAAPIPAAAVLSGAAVKAGVIGLIRFLPFDAGLPTWGEALAVIGLLSAFYGVLVGLTQANPKAVLAYSSISQMGFITALLGMGLATGNTAVPLIAAFYAMHHTLVKGGLFLALDAADERSPQYMWLVLLPAAVLALSLAGLPLTGGQLAKLVAKGPLGDGIVALFAQLSAAGSTLLMLHFLSRLHVGIPREPKAPPTVSVIVPWLMVAIAALALPWMLFSTVVDASWSDALAPKELWSALWSVLTGGLLAAILWPWRTALPAIPEGDIVVLRKRGAPAAHRLAVAFERVDGVSRQWPFASMCIGLLVLLMIVTLAMP